MEGDSNDVMFVEEMFQTIFRYILCVGLLHCLSVAAAQSEKVLTLQRELSNLDNNPDYEASFTIINQFIEQYGANKEDRYYAYIALSNLHKRLFNYEKVFTYLDSASVCVSGIAQKNQYYKDNISCLRAFALFDVQKYDDAEKLMSVLENNGYANIDPGDRAILIMQWGYIYYLDKDYEKSERKYDEALSEMKKVNPCNLPIIYGKKIPLYAHLNERDKMQEAYKLGYAIADSCSIQKYNLYMTEMMRNAHKDILNDYTTAYRYFDIYDSLNTIYNADDYKKNLTELEIKYQTNQRTQELIINQHKLASSNRLSAFLTACIAAILLIIALVVTTHRRKKIIKEKLRTQLFTKRLVEKIEDERKRIATELHDSVNNELLLIRSETTKNPEVVSSKIDTLMNHIRGISRNLHPVMFDEMGLQNSVEQLAYRIQEFNGFVLNTEIDYKDGLDKKEELQLFRIIQEATNNIIKYSKAVAGIIIMTQTDNAILVEVKDNGKGFNVDEALTNHQTFGLHNIIERTKMLKGNVKIISNHSGTCIHIKIPIKHGKGNKNNVS
jgi:signal transduction histidine kinase